MKRGRGGKEGVEHCWKRFAIIGNGLQLLGKRHMAAVLGAQTQGETHWQNDTSLAERPKDTNPYPGRDPYRGIHKGGRPPKAAALLCGGGAKLGLSLGTSSCEFCDTTAAGCGSNFHCRESDFRKGLDASVGPFYSPQIFYLAGVYIS